MDFHIELQDAEVRQGLQRLIHAGTDLTPAMRTIATFLADRSEEAFAQEQSPEGIPWQPLSQATLARRKKAGKPSAKLLQQDRHLLNSITADWDKTAAVAGTNVIYATTHQFGAKQGQFGQGNYTTRQGSFPIPWGDVPARPFLGVSATDAKEIENTIARFIAKQWQ